MKTIELLQYTLKCGTGRYFHKVMVEQSVQLHLAVGMDIVSFGNSIDDEDSYYLIRAYDNLEHLNMSQDRFYSSTAWRDGPRTAIVDAIDISVKSVFVVSESTLERMRAVRLSRQNCELITGYCIKENAEVIDYLNQLTLQNGLLSEQYRAF